VPADRPVSVNGTATENSSIPPTGAGETSAPEAAGTSKKSARDAVAPLAHMSYNDQLEHKKNTMAQILKRLVRSNVYPCTALNIYQLCFWRNC
jgi:tRNA (uracil-5-)-methyltransferase